MFEIIGFKRGGGLSPILGPFRIECFQTKVGAEVYLDKKHEELVSKYTEIQLIEVHKIYRSKLMPVNDEKERE